MLQREREKFPLFVQTKLLQNVVWHWFACALQMLVQHQVWPRQPHHFGFFSSVTLCRVGNGCSFILCAQLCASASLIRMIRPTGLVAAEHIINNGRPQQCTGTGTCWPREHGLTSARFFHESLKGRFRFFPLPPGQCVLYGDDR